MTRERLVRVGAAALATVLLAVCASCAGASDTTATGDPSYVGKLVGDVLHAEPGVIIEYAWDRGTPAGTSGVVISRRSEAAYRLDSLPDVNSSEGWFTILTGSTRNVLEATSFGCDWIVKDAEGEVHAAVSCSGDLDAGVATVLFYLDISEIHAVAPNRMVAGQSVPCYLTSRRTTFCVDETTGAILVIDAAHEGFRITARSIRETDAELSDLSALRERAGLESDFWDVPIDSLDLPEVRKPGSGN